MFFHDRRARKVSADVFGDDGCDVVLVIAMYTRCARDVQKRLVRALKMSFANVRWKNAS
jgi:hypothetical protein